MRRGQYSKARNALEKLLGPNRDDKVDEMLDEITTSVESEPQSNMTDQVSNKL